MDEGNLTPLKRGGPAERTERQRVDVTDRISDYQRQPDGTGPGGSGFPGLPRISASVRRMIIAAVVIVVLLILVSSSASWWVNWWWFGSTGYRQILTTRLIASSILFVSGFIIAALFIGANLVAALRRTRSSRPTGSLAIVTGRVLLAVLAVFTIIVSIGVGSAASSNWEQWLFALNRQSFGIDDPAYGMDVGFYFFILPVVLRVLGTITSLVVLSLLAVSGVYLLRSSVSTRSFRIPDRMRSHILVLGALLLVLIGVRYFVNNYLLVYSNRGPVTGVTYTDATIQQFANYALVVISIGAAIALLISIRRFQLRLLIIVAVVWVGAQLLLGAIVPAIVQRTFVEPSQLRRETPYIADNIAMTRESFGLEGLAASDLTSQGVPTQADLDSSPQTIDNVRLWDYRSATVAFQQLQAIERFYVFNDSDVDRYQINGVEEQVLVAPRELDVGGLPDNAQSWTNLHLRYTHGYGVVLSPVAGATNSGQPVFTIGGLTNLENAAVPITQPQIYFGESDLTYGVVNTNVAEYTEGTQIAEPYARQASGGIQLDDTFTRLMSWLALGDRNLAISGEITGDSQLLIHRGILDRVQRVAPFLQYDGDPYMVIADGQLVWVIDAYTTSDRWPGANSAGTVNYIRNSVKVTVNAYDGTMTFYRTDTPDPVADAYGKIYDNLFTPIVEAPPAIAEHFRYPELLFEAQSNILNRYHTTDPGTFYDGNDQWAVPPGGATGDALLEPYFVTLALPGEAVADFTLVRPFVPGARLARQNMAAWLGGRTDAQGNNMLTLYRFPRDNAPLGPQQIEASIDQNPTIAQELTLLGQGGSQIIRGNLLVIPIRDTILYVQPLYIQAVNSPGAFPQLGRVIVAGGGAVVMQPTYPEALAALVAGQGDQIPVDPATGTVPLVPEQTGTPAAGVPSITPGEQTLAGEALAAYDRAQAALAQGDWATYGQELATVEALLGQLSGTPIPQPTVAP